MADRLSAGGKTSEALERARQAVPYLSTAAATGDVSTLPQFAATLQLIAFLLAETGERAAALEMAGKAADIVQQYGRNEPEGFTGMRPVFWMRVGSMRIALARQNEAPLAQRLADWRAAMAAEEWRKSRAPRRQDEIEVLESKIAECGREIARLTPYSRN